MISSGNMGEMSRLARISGYFYSPIGNRASFMRRCFADITLGLVRIHQAIADFSTSLA